MITDATRKEMEDTIYIFFSKFDKSGRNTRHYKEMFQPMSNAQFDAFFKALFANPDAFLILTIVDYEATITLDDIEDAAAVINVPLFEYVYMPHLSMDKKHTIVTKERVPVGYINIKRPQQTISKKNGISTSIDSRSALTNQVTGGDKNGRESDLENTMLTSLGMTKTLEELNGPRSDDMVMKQQMLHDIAMNGYAEMGAMESNLDNKTTLNTVNAFLLGMMIDSDLVTSGLELKSTIR